MSRLRQLFDRYNWPWLLGFVFLQLAGVIVLVAVQDFSPLAPQHRLIFLWLLAAAAVTNLIFWFTLRQMQIRRQVQEQLQISSLRLREAQRIAKMGHWEWDIANQRLYWSTEIYWIYGQDPSSFTPDYEAFLATIPDDDRRRVEEAVAHTQQEGTPFEITHRTRLADGHEKIIHERGELIRDEQGRPAKMLGTAQDVTAQKRAEEELQNRLRLLAANAEMGMALTRDQPLEENLQACCQALVDHLDAALARIWLIPEQESVLQLAASAGLETRLDGEFSRLAIDPRTKIGDIALHRQPQIANQLRNDPQIRHPEWVEAHKLQGMAGHPLKVAGKVVGVLALFTRHQLPVSISDSLTSLADLIALGLEHKQNENRLRTQARIVDQIRDAIITTDPAGLIITWNQGAQRLFGYTAEQVRQRPLSFLLPPHEQDFYQGQVLPRLREQLSHQVEIEIQTKQGDYRFADFALTMLTAGDNHTDRGGGIICYARDITNRKKSEERIRFSSRFLEDTSEAVVITDVDANIIEVNQAFEKMTGYRREEALGRNPRILQSGHYDAEFYRDLWNTLLTTGHWEGEIWSRRKNNDLHPKWLSISAVYDQRGRITHYVGTSHDLTAFKQTQEKLEELAHYDQLTSLPNTLLFRDRLQQAMARARREGHQMALLIFDIDRFKEVNDSLGHSAGDLVLTEIAQRLRQELSSADTICRPGGDEFYLLLGRVTDIDTVVQVAQKVLALFGKPFRAANHELHLSPSIGIALFPDDAEEVDNLIQSVETAMYHAKKEGGNHFQFFQESMFTAALGKITLKNRLRKALEQDEFELYYQPKIAADGKTVVGAEALIRWVQPERGPVSPAEFIPLAEESGLIIPIGEWVLRQACRQSLLWQQAGLPPLRIAVNLSAVQFKQSGLSDEINWILEEIGLPAELLELEITESLLMEDVISANATLWKLKEMGIHLALDDFGTGYSSLSYLKNFPLDTLKIDREFVRDLSTDEEDRAVIITIITLAHSLKMEVVAEGVEDADQVAFLRQRNCDVFQGYHFSRPLPAGEFEEFLRRQIA